MIEVPNTLSVQGLEAKAGKPSLPSTQSTIPTGAKAKNAKI